jgi:NTP pyrophosphatase (non-canonical NTP hydrolase)
MEKSKILQLIDEELKSAKSKFPSWPDDPIHAAAILSEEAGEVTKAANEFYFENGSSLEMVKEAVQVGAMAIRFLEGMETYNKGLLSEIAGRSESLNREGAV